ncbi:tyrosine-type recombinase/integrase [Neomesorhizobium albiziae]|uniref:tyrosine-type recombinase/integrase n=1 Tax=Neomesorhizobium albiziae TaxID=335020 RepID=UPI001FCE4800|nr:tyrosine-type recombinase/integrase [Mesorhizobium albiziae]
MPSLQTKHVTPHSFRHATAVHLVSAGVDITVIRSWLGHVSLDTTNHYAKAIWKRNERHWNRSPSRQRQLIHHHGNGMRACSPGSTASEIMRRNVSGNVTNKPICTHSFTFLRPHD